MKSWQVLWALIVPAIAITPLEFAKSASNRIVVDQSVFFNWEYGGAIIFDALYDYKDAFNIDYTSLLDKYLTKFKVDPTSNPYGYQLLHGEKIPFDRAPGDGVGLFPINYLRQAVNFPKSNETETNWEIIDRTVSDFLLAWPYRLPDGTYSRQEGWGDEPGKDQFVWADDMYMGLTLLARVSGEVKDFRLADNVSSMLAQFTDYLMDKDGLIIHGYDDVDRKRSCCKWGRANGWAMMSHIEVMKAITVVPHVEPENIKRIQDGLIKQINGIVKVQSEDGRWYQVLDANSTFLETSGSAMFVYSMAEAVLNGWVAKTPEIDRSIRRGWLGMCKTLQDDGRITGIVQGTGVGTKVEDYNTRATLYVLSGPGLGSALRSAAAMERYFKKYGP